MVGTRERCDIEICIIELSPPCVTGPCCGLRSARASKPQTIYDFVECTIYNDRQYTILYNVQCISLGVW